MSVSLRHLSKIAAPRSHMTAIRAMPLVCTAAPKAFFTVPTSFKKATPLSSSPLIQQRRSESTKVERPISPHVQIYSFPIPALSSIANRVTGCAMSVGVIGMSMVALGGGCDIPAYVETMKTAAPLAMPLVKLAVGFPIVYHSVAGIRHLYWDKTAKHLELPEVEQSSKAVIAASVVISLGLAFYSLPALKD